MATKSAPHRDEVPVRNVWTPKQVAELLGVSPVTLRSWDSRYGIGPTVREAGRQRRYSAADVARLQRMQSLMSRGVRTREAADLVLSEQEDPLVARHAERTVRALREAADELRYAAMAGLLDDALAAVGPVAAWQEILAPLLRLLEERWTAGEPCYAAEWALSREISAALERYARTRGTALGGSPLLLACCPAERHTLPLEVLRTALAELNVPAVYVGPMVPPDTIVALTRNLSPALVVLWSMSPSTADVGVLRRIRRAGGRPCLAGPGWNQLGGHRTPRVNDLAEALTRITEMMATSSKSGSTKVR